MSITLALDSEIINKAVSSNVTETQCPVMFSSLLFQRFHFYFALIFCKKYLINPKPKYLLSHTNFSDLQHFCRFCFYAWMKWVCCVFFFLSEQYQIHLDLKLIPTHRNTIILKGIWRLDASMSFAVKWA